MPWPEPPIPATGALIVIHSLRFAMLWLLLAFTNADAQTPAETERAAIQAIIEAQLAAFARDDAEAAFALASDLIQEKFRNAPGFMLMVRTAYPAVYRPASVTFLPPEGGGNRFTQRVQFGDQDGRLWLALYEVIRLPDASWRINGCAMQPMPGTGT